MIICEGVAVKAEDQPFVPFSFERRDPLPHDVDIDILFCGICHSDLHAARNEWSRTVYPCVPGHEIVGRVRSIGSAVTRYKTGDLVGVGCMVGSCRICEHCRSGLEQYCLTGCIMTYNSPDAETGEGRHTFGGYSKRIVVNEDFVLRIPDNLDPAAVAPLLCAGITTYSPLRHWQAKPGMKIGVIGLGGLGHMAIKIGHAMGAEMTLFTTSSGKKEDALRLGAQQVVLSRDSEEMNRVVRSLDLIIDAVGVEHDINAYLATLKMNGTIVQIGLPGAPFAVNARSLISARRSFAGSFIGGIVETQEMLDFCSQHNFAADVEIISAKEIDTAYERMLKADVKYRFVIDMATL